MFLNRLNKLYKSVLLKCDGFNNCDNGADEIGCNSDHSCQGPDKYYCDNGDDGCCIDSASVCLSSDFCKCNSDSQDNYDSYGYTDYEDDMWVPF